MCSVEEVDGLILSALKRTGCEFKAKKLKDFTQENVFEAISRCLIQNFPTFSLHSSRLPSNMGDRFRMGTVMADKIKDLGFREDIGYQTILYGNDIEIRRLLIFLIEMLPKQTEMKTAAVVETAHEQLQKALTHSLKSRLVEPVWVPWFCKRYNFEWDGRFWYRCDQRAIPFQPQPLNIGDQHRSIIGQTSDRAECLSSINENNARLRYGIAEDSFVVLSHKPVVPSKPSHLLKPKPKLPPKPIVPKAEFKDEPAKDKNISIDSNAQVAVDIEVLSKSKSTAELNEISAEINALRQSLLRADHDLVEVESNTHEFQIRLKTMETEASTRKRFIDLLPNIDTNILKLREYLDSSETRSTTLMSHWEQHRKQLEQELTVLLEKSNEMPHLKLQEDIDNIADKIDKSDREFIEKQMLLSRLKNEAESNPAKSASTMGRNFYTKRILEIINNVRKQKEEIDRILEDVKVTQKDINMLSGKLDRTYKAADELMFEDAKRDELVKRAYRVFVNLHETCSETSNDVEITGQILREIRDLEDKIELETQNGVDKKLEMLITNLCEIREENEKLSNELEKRTST